MVKARRSTDCGTVILHATIVGAFAILVATGLRIATDDPDSQWLMHLDPLLPGEDLWYYHLLSGAVLSAALLAYVVYMRRARLQARVRLDRVRVLALLQPGDSRRAALGVFVYWLMMIALVAEVATGIDLFAGGGRTVLALHRDITFLCIATVIAHVALHASHGGLSQLLRVFRPAPLVLAPTPPDIADLLAEEIAKRSAAPPSEEAAPKPTGRGTAEPKEDVTLQSHPLATALVAALTVLGIAVGAERATRPVLHIVGVSPAQAPVLDGEISDPVWAKTMPVTVLTTQGGDFGGTHQSMVEIRAVHDGTYAYFAFVWDDPTRSLKHMPLFKRGGRWYIAASRDDLADESRFNEDKFAVLLAPPGFPLIGPAIHLARRPISDKPPSSTGRGLHFTTGGLADVWQWRASHGGVVGHIDNCHFGNPALPDAQPRDPAYQYSGGFALDPGQAGYESNVVESKDEAGNTVLLPRRLPRDLTAASAALGRISDRHGESESDGARWWMSVSETVSYSVERDAEIPDGTVIANIIVPDAVEGTSTSIRGAARWAAGRWTLELARRLYTASHLDVPIKSGVLMWVAAFDHAEKRHTRHLRPFRLEVD